MLVRRLARPMLASVFISEGVHTLRDPGPPAEAAEPVIDLIAEVAQPVAQKVAAVGREPVEAATRALDDTAPPAVADVATDVRSTVTGVAAGRPLPFETESYVKVNAAVQIGAGVLLAAGKLPRLSSAALAATLVPTTVAGHRFWEAEGAERKAQQTHFFKNLSLVGGLILAAVDTEGRPGLSYRASHAGKEARVVTAAAAANAAVGSRALRANARAAGRLARANASDAGEASRRRARAAGKVARREAVTYGKRARKEAQAFGRTASEHASHLSKVAQDRGQDLADAARASDLPEQAVARINELAARAQELVKA